MSQKGMIGLSVGMVLAFLLLAGSVLYLVGVAEDGLVAAPVVIYSALTVHFLARIGSSRQLWYVQRWQRLIRFVCMAGPIAVALGGLMSGAFGRPWLLLLVLSVVATSVGMWVALTERLKSNGEIDAV